MARGSVSAERTEKDATTADARQPRAAVKSAGVGCGCRLDRRRLTQDAAPAGLAVVVQQLCHAFVQAQPANADYIRSDLYCKSMC